MLSQDEYSTILIDKRADGVTIATLNRPEKLNAVNSAMHHELSRISVDATHDPDVKCLVLTGAGRAFCAGGDFSPDGAIGGHNLLDEARRIVDNLLDCPKPVVAAVNGYAMGLGATVALLADVVVASENAVFADTHVKMGLGAGDGGQVIWPFLMGVNRAKYFLMTGDRLDATTAEQLGLVNFVVDDDKMLDHALEIAGRLASGPGVAIAASKVPINT